jgi:hypothetical protein
LANGTVTGPTRRGSESFCEPAYKVAPWARASTTAQAGPMPASDWNGHRLSEVESRRLARIPFIN